MLAVSAGLSGCTTTWTEAQLKAADEAAAPRIRSNAEEVPPSLKGEAEAAFKEGKSYYIWCEWNSTPFVPSGVGFVREQERVLERLLAGGGGFPLCGYRQRVGFHLRA
jgi:hypothetical protein